MKKLILAVALLATSTVALADRDDFRGHGYRGYREVHEYHRGGDWIAPLVIGGVAGYVISQSTQPRQQTVILQQSQYQPLPSYVPANPEPIYQYQDTYFSDCGCYKRILVQIN